MKLQLLPNLTSLPCIDLTSSILVNPAHTWESLCGLRDPENIKVAAVHHDAIPKYRYAHETDLAYASRIANGHIGIKGDHPEGEPGNPYHIMIRNGRAYQNNNLLAFTYGIKSNNADTIHICIAGEYSETDDVTPEDYNMLNVVLVSLLNCSELPNLKAIKGHKEYAKTACPGIEMSQLRTDVNNIIYNMGHDLTEEDRFKRSYSIANYIQYLYNMAQGKGPNAEPVPQGARIWARERLLTLEDQVNVLKK